MSNTSVETNSFRGAVETSRGQSPLKAYLKETVPPKQVAIHALTQVILKSYSKTEYGKDFRSYQPAWFNMGHLPL